ncbi:MFS transporter [Alkalicoccus urumqiensis]|uniref:MFS transporter n=1 Tax=Alkalicoccus urumqiensis TaxID=1548213 RepID=A0A2P6MDW9_ALKUR|nr:MFS transporter [Alkalicoccus urumqiensis]PRO64446.1 MFS transporter [Alkalicoccus urumqiensis]
MRPSIWKLKGMLFFFHASMTIMISYLPIYFQYLGLTGGEIGILLAVGPAASIAAQPFWGFMSDKWKTVKKILVLCLTGALAVGFVLFQMEHFFFILLALFFFFSFLSPGGGLGDSLAQKTAAERSISFGSIRMWGSLGFGSASLLGGYILDWIGIQHIYAVFAVFLATAVVFAALAPDSRPSKNPVHLSGALALLKEKKLLLFLLCVVMVSLTHRMNDSFIGLYIVELGGSESLIGAAWFIGVFTEALVFATSIYWAGRFHPLTFISAAAFLYVIRWALFSAADGPGFLLFVQVTHGLAFGIFYLTAFQFVSRLVPKELESTGHLLFISVFFGISGMTGAAFGGFFIDLFNVRNLYFLMTAIACLGFAGSLVYRRMYINGEKA